MPWSNAFWPGLTPFGPPMWQAEADTELTLSASLTTAVGQKVCQKAVSQSERLMGSSKKSEPHLFQFKEFIAQFGGSI